MLDVLIIQPNLKKFSIQKHRELTCIGDEGTDTLSIDALIPSTSALTGLWRIGC